MDRQQGMFDYTFHRDAVWDMPTVNAWHTATRGLIVTPLEPVSDSRAVKGRKFVVTHELTGMRLHRYGGMTLRKARLVAGALSELCDWTFDDKHAQLRVAAEALHSAGMYDWLRDVAA